MNAEKRILISVSIWFFKKKLQVNKSTTNTGFAFRIRSAHNWDVFFEFGDIDNLEFKLLFVSTVQFNANIHGTELRTQTKMNAPKMILINSHDQKKHTHLLFENWDKKSGSHFKLLKPVATKTLSLDRNTELRWNVDRHRMTRMSKSTERNQFEPIHLHSLHIQTCMHPIIQPKSLNGTETGDKLCDTICNYTHTIWMSN